MKIRKRGSGKGIIKSKIYNGCYYYGRGKYGNDLYKAKIFDWEEIIKEYKSLLSKSEYKDILIYNSNEEELILLDSQKGIKLIKDNIRALEKEIDRAEIKLCNKKEGLKKLFNLEKLLINNFK